MGGKRMNHLQNKEIERLLAKHVEKLDNGMCRYLDDASDTSIAAEMRMLGHGFCSKHHVAAIRVLLYGKTRTAREEMYNATLVNPEAFTELQNKFNDLVHKYNDHITGEFDGHRAQDKKIEKLQRDVLMILEWATRTQGVNWTLEQFRNANAPKKPGNGNGGDDDNPVPVA